MGFLCFGLPSNVVAINQCIKFFDRKNKLTLRDLDVTNGEFCLYVPNILKGFVNSVRSKDRPEHLL